MAGSEHVPRFRRNSAPPEQNLFAIRAVDWLLSHRKLDNITCPGDVDRNAIVAPDDILLVISDWGSSDTASDINDDGIVNVIDLLAVLDAWGPCQ